MKKVDFIYEFKFLSHDFNLFIFRQHQIMEEYGKYITNEMKELMSLKYKYTLFRKLWVIMASIQKDLGFEKITNDMLQEMATYINVTDEDLIYATEQEKMSKHDVMAQIAAFKKHLLPENSRYIHMCSTSAYVTDNTDMLIYIKALSTIENKLIFLLQQLNVLSQQEKNTICVGYTHYQPAQFVTLGKRFALWNQDIYFHLKRLRRLIKEDLYLLGAKGATGTQDSYLKLFTEDQVAKIDEIFSGTFGIQVIPLSGQTYTRTLDNMILDQLGEICSSMHKISTNIRLSQHDNEVYEPFDEHQVGSSAMAYKQNPMRCERICSLSRIIINNKNIDNDAHQWFERTLDDSANRRLKLKESLILTDYIVTLMCNVFSGIKIRYNVIESHVREQLNYIVTENIMMKMCSFGKDRQEVHEKIRQLTLKIKDNELNGIYCNIIDEIKKDNYFEDIYDIVDNMMNPNLYTGMCSKQVDEFSKLINDYINFDCTPFNISFSH